MVVVPKLPYRSLDMMFNHLNIWVNKQDPNPTKLWFDIWRSSYWHQFASYNYEIRPCFTPRAFGTVSSSTVTSALKIEVGKSNF